MMTMKKEPQLRFSGFEGEWEEDRIKNLGKLTSGIGFSEKYQGYKNFDTNFYKVSDMNSVGNEKYMHIANNTVSDDIILSLKTKVICSPSIIFAKVGAAIFLERKRIVTKQFLIDNNMMAFTPYEVNNLEWLYYRFNNLCFSKYAQTGALPSYNASDIGNIKFSIPSLSEQQKIADCLTAMDESIESQQQKVEQLKDYKKGLLQQLFSQSLRFPGFEGEWEEKKLGDMGHTYTGLSGKTKEDFGVGDSKFVTYMNVFSNTFSTLNQLEKVSISDDEKQNSVKKGDIFFTTSSETPTEAGMSSCWDFEEENVYLNSFCFGYRLKNDNNASFRFLAHSLRNPLIRKQISVLAQGSTRFNISKNELMKMNVYIPSLPEQQKIADCLSTLDEVIELENKKLEQLRQYKKGLLQQLFV